MLVDDEPDILFTYESFLSDTAIETRSFSTDHRMRRCRILLIVLNKVLEKYPLQMDLSFISYNDCVYRKKVYKISMKGIEERVEKKSDHFGGSKARLE